MTLEKNWLEGERWTKPSYSETEKTQNIQMLEYTNNFVWTGLNNQRITGPYFF